MMVKHMTYNLSGQICGLNIGRGSAKNYFLFKKGCSEQAGFEPTQGNPIRFQVQRLNHSAITYIIIYVARFCPYFNEVVSSRCPQQGKHKVFNKIFKYGRDLLLHNVKAT